MNSMMTPWPQTVWDGRERIIFCSASKEKSRTWRLAVVHATQAYPEKVSVVFYPSLIGS